MTSRQCTSEAPGMYHKTPVIDEKDHGPEHPGVAVTYSNKGCAHGLMGDFPKALEYHSHNLESKLRVPSPEYLLAADTKITLRSYTRTRQSTQKPFKCTKRSLKSS